MKLTFGGYHFKKQYNLVFVLLFIFADNKKKECDNNHIPQKYYEFECLTSIFIINFINDCPYTPQHVFNFTVQPVNHEEQAELLTNIIISLSFRQSKLPPAC